MKADLAGSPDASSSAHRGSDSDTHCGAAVVVRHDEDTHGLDLENTSASADCTVQASPEAHPYTDRLRDFEPSLGHPFHFVE